jgi:hypothetical protein
MGEDEMTWIPEQEEETESFGLVEKGGYLCLISDAQVAMKDINTRGVKVTLQILNPNSTVETKYENRKLFLYYSWDNRNDMAVKLGRQKLADLLFAIETDSKKPFNTPDDVCDELVNKEVLCNVTTRKRSDTGEMQNDVQMYFRKDGVHRGTKQNFKLLTWGGVESGLGSGRANGPAILAESEDGVPF